jgi:hypothetical protein
MARPRRAPYRGALSAARLVCVPNLRGMLTARVLAWQGYLYRHNRLLAQLHRPASGARRVNRLTASVLYQSGMPSEYPRRPRPACSPASGIPISAGIRNGNHTGKRTGIWIGCWDLYG